MAEGVETKIGCKILTLSGSDPALEPYRNLIYASFMNSLRYGNNWYEDIDSFAFYRAYQVVITNLLNKTGMIVKLAVLPDDFDTCIGWSLSENEVLHYVFVKGDIEARGKGIGTALLPEKFHTLTHLTTKGRAIWKRKFPRALFNPFL